MTNCEASNDMNQRRIIIVALVGILTIACGCNGIWLTGRPTSDHGIVLTLYPAKKGFNVGEPVVVEARIHNNSDKEVLLPDFNFWGQVWPTGEGRSKPAKTSSSTVLWIEPWPDGVPQWNRGLCYGPEFLGGLFADGLRIPPRRGVSRHFKLSDVLNGGILPPGEYGIAARYEGKADGIKWRLLSNSVKVRILPVLHEGLCISLSTPKREIRPGQPLTVAVEFYNGGEKTFFLPPFWPDHHWPTYGMDNGADKEAQERAATERERVNQLCPPEARGALVSSVSWAAVWVRASPSPAWRDPELELKERPLKDLKLLFLPPKGGLVENLEFPADDVAKLKPGEYTMFAIYKATTPDIDIELLSSPAKFEVLPSEER